MVMVRSLAPQEMTDVSVQMQSPVSPGMYQGQWRMSTATGLYFGGKEGNYKQSINVNCCFLIDAIDVRNVFPNQSRFGNTVVHDRLSSKHGLDSCVISQVLLSCKVTYFGQTLRSDEIVNPEKVEASQPTNQTCFDFLELFLLVIIIPGKKKGNNKIL